MFRTIKNREWKWKINSICINHYFQHIYSYFGKIWVRKIGDTRKMTVGNVTASFHEIAKSRSVTSYHPKNPRSLNFHSFYHHLRLRNTLRVATWQYQRLLFPLRHSPFLSYTSHEYVFLSFRPLDDHHKVIDTHNFRPIRLKWTYSLVAVSIFSTCKRAVAGPTG